jgi:transcriptional regulator with XRE-family HTH domain
MECLSQRALAEQIECDFTYLSKIECGKVLPPSSVMIRKLAKVLRLNVEELLEMAKKPTIAQLRAENKELRARLRALGVKE